VINLTRPDGNRPDDQHLSRRGALAGALFAGYAAFALSADADPIHTDDSGLVTATVMLPTAGRALPAYFARPAGPGRVPAVLVISEVFGLHEYIRDICRRLAKAGYAAIAPAFFVRVGDPAPLTDFPSIMKIVGAASDPQVLGDIRVAVAFLKAQPSVDASRLAVTGFCWGGRFAWLSCEEVPDFKAGVAWYGQLAPDPAAAPNPARHWPLNEAATLHAPVLGLYGGKDPLSAEVPAMRAALAAAGKQGTTIVVYPDAGHGFHADYRASYNAPDARDGWARLLDHFKDNGVGPGAR
jgi:carboxymethylenebutenolidase